MAVCFKLDQHHLHICFLLASVAMLGIASGAASWDGDWSTSTRQLSKGSLSQDVYKLFTYHKDEDELLADWVSYHAPVFGHRNIYIIDNNTTSAIALSVLEAVEKAGVHVIRLGSLAGVTGSVQGSSLTELMRDVAQQNNHAAEVLVPIDVDEFIVSSSPNGRLSADVRMVRREFKRLSRLQDGKSFKFKAIASAHCENEEVASRRVLQATHLSKPAEPRCQFKTFFPAATFVETGEGNHHGRLENAPAMCTDKFNATRGPGCMSCYHVSNLGIVHYGHAESMSWLSYVKKMNLHAQRYGYVETVQQGKKCRGWGSKSCKDFTQWYKNATVFQLKIQRRRQQLCNKYVYNRIIADVVLKVDSP